MTQVHARSTFPQSFTGSLGVVRPLGALRLGAGLAHTPLKWLGEPICTGQGVRTNDQRSAQRSVRSVGISDRSVGDLRSTGRTVWKKLDAAGRFESFFSLSLERERSAGETAHRCTHTGASVFDRRQKFCDSAARLDGLAKLNSRSNGLEGQTEPEMKTATHGADEGRLDLQKSVLISRRQKFCESATARPYDGDVKWGQCLPNSRSVPSPRCSNKYDTLQACWSLQLHVVLWHARACAFSHHSSIVHCLHPVTSCKACRCAFDQRPVGLLRERSVVRLITPKGLKEARRCELVLRDSFPFRWSASEVQAKWPVSAPPSVLDRQQKFWKSAARLDRYVEFTMALKSWGERQTNRARIKAPWTH